MKKILGLFSVLTLLFCFTITARAADEQKSIEDRVKALEDTLGTWSFYGSARFNTFYNSSSDDPLPASSGMQPDTKNTTWDLSSVSRFGATVNKGNLGGQVEMGIDDDGANVYTRLIYGTYTIGDAKVTLGQDWAPLGIMFYANQVYWDDLDLIGFGFLFEPRTPQVKLDWKGLEVALLEPPSDADLGMYDYKREVVVPKIEARYHFTAEKFFGDVFGGAYTYKVKSEADDVDKSINSYVYGVAAGVTLDPVYASAMVWSARNGVQYGLVVGDGALGARFDDPGTDHIANEDNLGYMLVLGTKIQKVTVEAGYGRVSSESDLAGAKKDEAQSCYLNATIPIVQTNGAKIFVVPEIGMMDYMKDAAGEKQGKITYGGAKWQVNF